MRRLDVAKRPGFRTAKASHKARPTVESIEQRILLTTFTVTNTSDVIAPAGQPLTVGTLRTAIIQANLDTAAPTIIQFNIAATGAVQTISPTQTLPTITRSMLIDGTFEQLYSGSPLIEINGSSAGLGVTGLTISAGNTTVQGLTINRFTGNGIALTTTGGNTITANFIGTASSGFAAGANGLDGVAVSAGSNANTISNNLISGNSGNGINLNGQLGGTATTTTTGNIISNNRIGINVSGTGVVGNTGNGINVVNAPTTSITTGNRIAGNRNGIELFGNSIGTVVQSNFIGVAANGTTPLGNGPAGTLANGTVTTGSGIVLHGITDSTIGGAGLGNLISGNANSGIFAFGGGSSGITIQGNMIGTNATGTGAISNSGAGINLGGTTNVTIGGNSIATRNIISGNTGAGITSSGSGLIVQGNYIGVATNGTTALGNSGPGIITVSGAIIGETLANAAANILTGAVNIIANNSIGVQVTGGGSNNSILSNSIYGNISVGIQNPSESAPTLATAVSRTGSSTYTGTINNTTAGTYLLQFFSTPRPSNVSIQGRTLIGSVTVTSTGGNFAFSSIVNAEFLPGSFISMTSTRSVAGDPNSTSPFSTSQIVGTGSGLGTVNPVITVTTSPTTVVAGNNVTYTFQIFNPGTVDAQGVNFSDAIPAGTTFVSGTTSTGVPVVLTNNVANAGIGRIAAGATVTVTIVLASGSASFTNTGLITSTVPTVIASDNDSASATTNVTASADLAVNVVGPFDPIAIGATITYQVTISNSGPSVAANVVLNDLLPTGTTYVSASSDVAGATFTLLGGSVTGTFGSLASGGLINVIIIVQTDPNTPSQVFDTATVSSDTADSDTTNNTAVSNTTTVVPSADVAILSETATPTNVLAGQTVTYTIIVSNNGPSPATGVTLVDTLPNGLTFVSGTVAGGSVSFLNGLVIAPVGSIAAGQQTTVTLVLMPMFAGTFTDSVVVSATQLDPNGNNNSSSATITAFAISDVSVTLAAPTGSGNVGEPLTFTATVTNNGPSPAANVQFAAALPVGFTFTSGLSPVTLVGGNISAVINSLAAGASAQLSFTLTPTLAGTFTLTANVSNANPDPDPTNNTASVTTTVVLPSPILTFNMGLTTVNENAGVATILLNRVGSTGTEVSVRFSTTTGGNATPGLDYTPVSTIVVFPVGVSQVAVTVPVLANPFDRLNELVALQLDSPTGGAILPNGASSITATLQIINTDPDLVGPTITELKLFGPINAITGVEIDTDGGLDPTTASLAANYSFLAMGGAIPAGTIIPAGLAVYNPTTGAILVIPSQPLPANELFTIVVNGTTGTPVSDLAGNPLNSTFGSVPGSNYGLTIARGSNLNYVDENGTNVHLRLTGPGSLDINQAISGQLGRLQILGATKATSLSGSVSPRGRSTNIGVILGFGQFGVVKTKLKTPPFYVSNRAFKSSTALVGPAAVDSITGGSIVVPTTVTTSPTTVTKKSKVQVKATSRANHPHAAVAQSVHARTHR